MKQFIKQGATLLDDAANKVSPIEQLSIHGDFSLAEAYAIQKELIDKRLLRSVHLSGIKLGFTSKAKMEQVGVNELIWGHLTNNMNIANKAALDFSRFIRPRAEPEIAFQLSQDVDQMTFPVNPLECISGIAVAIEVIDSRYKNFKFKLEDIVADNCSSAAYVIGAWHSPKTTVNNLDITMSQNDNLVQSGNSNAILGNPLASLEKGLMLARQNNVPLKKGMIILAGAATPSIYLNQGDHISVTAEHLGQVELNVI